MSHMFLVLDVDAVHQTAKNMKDHYKKAIKREKLLNMCPKIAISLNVHQNFHETGWTLISWQENAARPLQLNMKIMKILSYGGLVINEVVLF